MIEFADGPEPDDGVADADISGIQIYAFNARVVAETRAKEARSLTIENPDDARAVAQRMKDNAAAIKEVQEKFEPAIEQARRALDEVRMLRDSALAAYQTELNYLKLAWGAWDKVRKAEIEARRIEAESAARDRLVHEAKVQAIEQDLPPAAIVAAVQRAESAPVSVNVEVPSDEGISTRKRLFLFIDDKDLLVKAIAAGHPQTSMGWLKVEEARIKEAVRSMGPVFKVPGVRFEWGSSVAVRSGK